MNPARIETGAHPRREGSYGPQIVDWSHHHRGLHMRPIVGLRPWQAHALDRAFEHDGDGKLLWQTVILSAPRQTGKSYVERVACDWRIHAAPLIGEPQDVLHLAHKLVAAQEVWRPAARYEATQGARVRWANGEQMIELGDGSRWLIQAANDGAGVAFSLSMVLVDEAWRVARHIVDAAVGPTMAEAEQPQLWLVSTAGTSASDLMLTYRSLAMGDLDPGPDSSILILEWSAPPDEDTDLDDPRVWRAASPHWDERREARVRKARGEADEWQFRQQWLNQWIPAMSKPLFDASAWAANTWRAAFPDGPVGFGVDVAADRTRGVVVASCGGVVEVVEDRPGVAWLAGRVRELVERWRPVGVVLDVSGPAVTVAEELSLDVDVADVLMPLNGHDASSACMTCFDAILQGAVVGTETSSALAAAVASARQRRYGQSWTFARDAPNGCVMIAAACAVWACDHAPAEVEASSIW
jgi:hypothetical protein